MTRNFISSWSVLSVIFNFMASLDKCFFTLAFILLWFILYFCILRICFFGITNWKLTKSGDWKNNNNAMVFYFSMWIHLKNFYILERNLRWPDSALMLKKSGIWGQAHDMFSRISQVRIYESTEYIFGILLPKLFWPTLRKKLF